VYEDATLIPAAWFTSELVGFPAAPVVAPLDPSGATATATLALQAPTVTPLDPSAATAAGTLALRAPAIIPLASSPAVASGTMGLFYAGTVLSTPGLVSYWRLGEASGSALDSKDSNPGTVFGGVTRQVAGLITNDSDTAMQSDGVTGTYVNMPSNANMNVGAQLSVECWVKPAGIHATASPFAVGRLGSSLDWYIRHYQTGDARWEFTVYDTAVVSTTVTSSSAEAAQVGKRQHLVMTYDAAGTMKAYVDGVSVGTQSRTPNANVRNNAEAFRVFSRDATDVNTFNGTIDEVAFYNTALSAQQVLDHYNAGAPSVPITVPLNSSSGTGTGTLALTAPAPVVVALAPSPATASGTMGLFYAGVILSTPGLVSYWRLGESSGAALDSKGTNPSTFVGSGTTRAVSGLITGDPDGAVQNNGTTGSYIGIPSSASMSTGAQLTVEFWIKPSALTSVSTGLVNRSSAATLFLLQLTSLNRYRWYVRDVNLVDSIVDGSGVTNPPTVGIRQHVVGVYDAAGTMKLYVNGASQGSLNRTPDANTRTATQALNFFAESASLAAFNGVLDEIALYNTALTAQQVLNHYNAGAPTVPITVALGPGSGVGSGALALRAPTQVLLDPSLATATATAAVSTAVGRDLDLSWSIGASVGAATLPLAAGSAQASATLALRAPAIVALAAGSGVGTGTLALRAPTLVPLDAASATATATAALRAPTSVPLAVSPAVATATAALRAPTSVPLTAGTGAATGTLSLIAPAIIPLAASSAIATATVALRAPPSLALAAAGTAVATLDLRAPTTIPLAAAASAATATLSLTTGTAAPAILPLSAAASTATGTLALLAPALLALDPAPAAATGVLALRAPTTAPLQASAATASATLALTTGVAAPAVLPLDPAAAVATATLAVRAPTAIVLATAPATASGTLNLFVPGVATIGIVGAATATATLALQAPTTVPLAASSAQASALVALTAPARLTLSASAQASATLSLQAAPSLSLAGSAQGTATLALLTRANLILSASGQANGTLTLSVPTVGPATLLLDPGQAFSSGQLSLRLVPRLVLVTTAQASGSLVVISTSLLEKHKRLYLEVPEQDLSPTTMITEGYIHLMVREPDIANQMVASIDERFCTVVVDETVMKVQIAEGRYLVAQIDIPENDTVEVSE
jgi:hypothetical protein